MDTKTLLNLSNIQVSYGGVRALDGVDIALNEGEIVALMGPNGAGKSTILKVIFGLTPIVAGSMQWYGQPFIPIPHQVVRNGIAFVPQGRRVFSRLTVEENLEIGGHSIQNKNDLQQRITGVMDIFPVLKQKRHMQSGALSGGQQQMLALARGLMVEPKVLLLDEPSLGLAPKVVKEVFKKIQEINNNRKTAIMIVEHNIKSLLAIANRGYILDRGKIVADEDVKKLMHSTILEKVFTGTM